jgi:hypothetical protein
MMPKRIQIRENSVFQPTTFDAPRDPFRRVIAVVNGVVIYSNGSDKNYSVKRRSFLRWIRANECRLAHAGT